MGSPRQNFSLVHDPLGLLALPMTTTDDGPRPGTHNAKSLGMVLTALVVVFIMINLVSFPGPAKEAQAIPHCHLEVG